MDPYQRMMSDDSWENSERVPVGFVAGAYVVLKNIYRHMVKWMDG